MCNGHAQLGKNGTSLVLGHDFLFPIRKRSIDFSWYDITRMFNFYCWIFTQQYDIIEIWHDRYTLNHEWWNNFMLAREILKILLTGCYPSLVKNLYVFRSQCPSNVRTHGFLFDMSLLAKGCYFRIALLISRVTANYHLRTTVSIGYYWALYCSKS